MKDDEKKDGKKQAQRAGDKEEAAIKVICVGLGRTGTLSLTEAMKQLGYKPYHYVDMRHAQAWADFSVSFHGRNDDNNDNNNNQDVDSIIDMIVNDGYNVTVENPTCDIYQDLLRRYPDAKVVLTVRDSPEAFEKSWKTLFDTMVITEQDFSWRFPSFFQWIPLFRALKETRRMMGTTHLGLERGELTNGWRNQPEGWLAQQYVRHNEHIQQNVKKEQLLVFNVKQGWKPLCEFLGKDIPKNDEPFPHCKLNDAKALRKLKRTFLIAVYSWIPCLLVSGMATVGGALWYRSHRNAAASTTVAGETRQRAGGEL